MSCCWQGDRAAAITSSTEGGTDLSSCFNSDLPSSCTSAQNASMRAINLVTLKVWLGKIGPFPLQIRDLHLLRNLLKLGMCIPSRPDRESRQVIASFWWLCTGILFKCSTDVVWPVWLFQNDSQFQSQFCCQVACFFLMRLRLLG